MAAKCAELGAEKEIGPVITHNGVPIPPWTDTAKEYLVVARFPHLQKRKSFESGLDCLTLRGSFVRGGLSSSSSGRGAGLIQYSESFNLVNLNL